MVRSVGTLEFPFWAASTIGLAIENAGESITSREPLPPRIWYLGRWGSPIGNTSGSFCPTNFAPIDRRRRRPSAEGRALLLPSNSTKESHLAQFTHAGQSATVRGSSEWRCGKCWGYPRNWLESFFIDPDRSESFFSSRVEKDGRFASLFLGGGRDFTQSGRIVAA